MDPILERAAGVQIFRPEAMAPFSFEVNPSTSWHAWQWAGTAFVPGDSLPVWDRGFRYGMALYESFRVEAGRAFFLAEHLRLLRDAARHREFQVHEEAVAAVGPLLQQQGSSGFARLYFTAGEGGPTAPADAGRLFLLLEERAWTPPDPLRLALAEEPHHPLFGGLKTANYWANLDALQRAQRRGFDEVLLFGEEEELISAATGNVFLALDGMLCTPTLASGARAGVVREWVLSRWPVREVSLLRGDVQRAEEIFITSSWRGLATVCETEGRTLPSAARCAEFGAEYRSALRAPQPGGVSSKFRGGERD